MGQQMYSIESDSPLAPKEGQYFLGFIAGLSDKEVAKVFGVSPNTVAGARKRILYKLNAHRMTEAIAVAFAQGFVRHLSVLFIVLLLVGPGGGAGENNQPLQRHRTRTTQTVRIRREIPHVFS